MEWTRRILALLVVVLASRAPLVVAEKVKESPVQLMVCLTDGSRIAGETSLTSLPLRSVALGKVEIPIEKIRTIKFSADHTSAMVALGNGDKVQGGIETVSLKLRTLVGVVTIPLDKTTEIEVRQCGGSLVEWEALPFPTTSDWPGPRGEPATIDSGEVVLRGRPVRTKQTYSGPLNFECELTLERLRGNDGAVWVSFVPEGSNPDTDPPPETVTVELGYQQRNGSGGHLRVRGQQLKQLFEFEAGKSYRLGIEVLPNAMRVTLNDQVFEAEGVTLPFKTFHIQLQGWQPVNVWHVRNFTVR